MDSESRLRWGPRKEGMAQKPHALSHPSAIFTYAHGRSEAGRRKLSKSNCGASASAIADSPSGRVRKLTGTPKPATRSTSGRASASSTPYRSAMQPVTTIRESAERSLSKAKIVLIDSSLASSINAHVLTTTKSATDGSSVGVRPSSISDPAILSESTWFLGHPKVWRWKLCAEGVITPLGYDLTAVSRSEMRANIKI